MLGGWVGGGGGGGVPGELTISQPRFFVLQNIVPQQKNPVALLRIHSRKVFLKACPKFSVVP